MSKKSKHKNRTTAFLLAAADSEPSKFGTSADDPGGKNSTSNPNSVSFDWQTCTKEAQLEKITRKKLENLYGEALSTLVSKGYDEDVALKGLLERGYCFGEADCLTNIVENSLKFLTGKDVESEQDPRPEPFKNLELLMEFNLQFMVYILQKYRPNLNRMSIRRCILMTDLNLNRAIIMKINRKSFDIKDMPADLNLDDLDGNNEEIDWFLALEIKELFNDLNLLDESISEVMKDAMIADLQKPIEDLKPRLKERIRWAIKKVEEARKKQSFTTLSLTEEVQLLKYATESKLAKRDSELSEVNIELANAEETLKRLKMEKEEIRAEISASKLIVSEARQKILQVSKKTGRMKNWEKQKEELQEEIELEKKKISKWGEQLVDIEEAIIPAMVKLKGVMKERKAIIAQVDKEYELVLESWDGDMLLDQVGRMMNALALAKYGVQDERIKLIKMLSQADEEAA